MRSISERPRSTVSPCADPMPALGRIGTIYRGGRTHDPSVQRLGEIGQPRRLVDRVADNGVFITVFGADVSGEHRPGGYAYPEVDHR